MLLSTDIWVGALIRRAELGGAFATVARKGDARAGAVLVKTYNPLDRVTAIYAEAFRGDGERVWMQPTASHEEPDLDRYIERGGARGPPTCGWWKSRTSRAATSSPSPSRIVNCVP